MLSLQTKFGDHDLVKFTKKKGTLDLTHKMMPRGIPQKMCLDLLNSVTEFVTREGSVRSVVFPRHLFAVEDMTEPEKRERLEAILALLRAFRFSSHPVKVQIGQIGEYTLNGQFYEVTEFSRGAMPPIIECIRETPIIRGIAFINISFSDEALASLSALLRTDQLIFVDLSHSSGRTYHDFIGNRAILENRSIRVFPSDTTAATKRVLEKNRETRHQLTSLAAATIRNNNKKEQQQPLYDESTLMLQLLDRIKRCQYLPVEPVVKPHRTENPWK